MFCLVLGKNLLDEVLSLSPFFLTGETQVLELVPGFLEDRGLKVPGMLTVENRAFGMLC